MGSSRLANCGVVQQQVVRRLCELTGKSKISQEGGNRQRSREREATHPWAGVALPMMLESKNMSVTGSSSAFAMNASVALPWRMTSSVDSRQAMPHALNSGTAHTALPHASTGVPAHHRGGRQSTSAVEAGECGCAGTSNALKAAAQPLPQLRPRHRVVRLQGKVH